MLDLPALCEPRRNPRGSPLACPARVWERGNPKFRSSCSQDRTVVGRWEGRLPPRPRSCGGGGEGRLSPLSSPPRPAEAVVSCSPGEKIVPIAFLWGREGGNAQEGDSTRVESRFAPTTPDHFGLSAELGSVAHFWEPSPPSPGLLGRLCSQVSPPSCL